MKVIIENSTIKVNGVDEVTRAHLRKALSYTDRSKQYQLKRLAKNPFNKRTAHYKKLEQEVHGCLLDEHEDGSVSLPSGFAHMFSDFGDVVDNRGLSGEEISLPWKEKPFDLRPYQEEAVELMLNNYRGLVNFATGLGKTLTAVYAIRKSKRKTLVLCPGKTIADNFYDELCSAFGDKKVGYFGDGKKKIRDITVGIAQSVNNHVDDFAAADLGMIIVDEVHHVPATTFFDITSRLSHVGRIYGLTATDFRTDGKDVMITAGVGEVLIKRDIVWGVDNGWLADPYIIVRGIETSGRDYPDDKNKNYKEHVLNSKSTTDRIISDCQKFLDAGKSVLCLVSEVDHGKLISEQLGLPFATGTDKKSKSYIKQLNEGEITGLIGTSSKIGEGTDTKNVDVLVLANFVASKGPLWQNLGRGLRVHGDDSKVVVLDYCPLGSSMMVRHCKNRIRFYKEITDNIRVINI